MIDDAELIRRVSSWVGRGPRPVPPRYSPQAEINWNRFVPMMSRVNRAVFALDPALYGGRFLGAEEARLYEMHARLTAPRLPYDSPPFECRYTFDVAYDGTMPPGTEEEIEAALASEIHSELVKNIADLKSESIQPRFYLLAAMPNHVIIDPQTFEPVIEIYMAYQPA